MDFMNRIVEYLNDITDFFYDLYIECYYAYYIPNVIANLFYEICLIFNRLAWRFYDFGKWVDDIADDVQKLGIWGAIKKLIIGWLPGLEDAVTFVDNLVDEFLVFAQDPITYLRDQTITTIFPWAISRIPWVSDIYTWYVNNRKELTELFNDPWKYLRDKVYPRVWDWILIKIPVIGVAYSFYENFKDEIDTFTDNPTLWWHDKLENVVLPWAKEKIPFFSTLYLLYENYWDKIKLFFDDPVDWLYTNTILGELKKFWDNPLQWAYDKLDEFFERFW